MTSPSIDKLPTEILASIFVLLAEELHTVWCQSRCMPLAAYFSDEEFARITFGRPKSRKVLLLMVCRRWHNVAINCPSFWRYIVVDTYQSTERQLELAQEAPLDVFTTLSPHNETQTEWGLSLVLGEIHRVQDLVVCAHGGRRVDHEPDNLYMEVTAPILRSLSIHHLCNDCNDDDPRRNIVRKIGHEWDAPRLQHYASHGGQEVLSWADPGTHPALRWKDTLTIFVWLPDLHSQNICPSAEALLEVVCQLPHLHTLQVALSPTYPVQPTQPLSERAKINRVRLPGLRRLMLHGNFQSCFDVIDHIDHPHSLRQLVIIAGHPLETPDLRETVPLVDLFAEHLTRDSTDSSEAQAENSKHMRTLYIYPDESKSTSTRILASSKLLNHTVNFPSRSQDALRDIACDGKYPDLDLCLILPQKILRTQFEVLLEGTNFRKVEKLEVHGNPLDEPSDWVIMEHYQPTKLHSEWSSKVFSLLDNVHTLRVHEPIDPGLLKTY